MHVETSAEPPARRSTADLAVIGAGTMGAWTAYWSQAGGAGQDGRGGGGRRVILVDGWGPGHPRATSGDETRIIRSAHGDDALYARWARRAREHWLRFGSEWGERLFIPSGVLWFAHREDGFEQRSARVLRSLDIPCEWLDTPELLGRWPQLGDGGGLIGALYEPEAGALMARRGCMAATAAFERAGGRFVHAAVRPGGTAGGRLTEVVAADGTRIAAETFVFASGPWLPALFPDAVGGLIRVTKQDVVFVGPRGGDERFAAEALPSWADYDAAYYGIPQVDGRGFKLAPDRYGPLFDPTNGERIVDPESVRLARAYLRQRFPDLAGAPVVETRVCQYESTPDAHFLIAQHPGLDNVWLVGGGSGHGFKHGPRIGEYLTLRLDGVPEGAQDGAEESRFRLGPRSAAAAARTAGDSMASTWEIV